MFSAFVKNFKATRQEKRLSHFAVQLFENYEQVAFVMIFFLLMYICTYVENFKAPSSTIFHQHMYHYRILRDVRYAKGTPYF
jgi:hypothetical protein